MTNFYWSVYKNLENELIDLSFNVHFDDAQFEYYTEKGDNGNLIATPPYSYRIGELLIRCCTEIEAVVQALSQGHDEKIRSMPSLTERGI